MKLFTKDIDKKLFAQYQEGSDLDKQVAVAKIFNPYGNGRWFLLNSDPQDPDYLWAIVQMGDVVEVGSVLRSELESVRVSPFKFPLERDLGFSMVNAGELYRGLLQGKFYKKGGMVDGYARGGMVAGRWYKDNTGNELRYIGETEGKLLFNDGEKLVTKTEGDFEEELKEKKLFGFFEEGGFVDKTDEELKGLSDDELFEYLDAKAAYMKQYARPLSSFKAKNYAANSAAVQFQNEGTSKLDANFPSLSKINEQATKDYQETISKKSDKMAKGGDLTDNPNLEQLEKELEEKNKELKLVYAEYWSMKAGDDFETNAKKKYKLQQEVEALEKSIDKTKEKEGKYALYEFERTYPFVKNGKRVGEEHNYLTVWAVSERDARKKASDMYYKNGAKSYSVDQVKMLTDFDGNKLDPSYKTPEDYVDPYSEEILRMYEKGYDKYENKNKKQKVDEGYREKLKDYILYKYSKKYIDNYKLIPVSPEEGSPYVWKLKGKKIEILFDPFYETENEIVVNVYKNEDDLLEQTDVKYKLTGYLEKDSEKYIDLLKPYFVKYSSKMAMGGKVKFQDKVKAIKASLLKTKKVPKKVQKDYGKTYNAKEAELAAKRIAGAMAKKGMK